MKTIAGVIAIARADFFERTRRYQYLVTIAVTLYLGILFVPPKNANYIAFTVDGYRGVYNSAWVGAMLAVLATMTLSLFGFYLIKSAVEVDRQTRVGEIVASTSIGKFDYALGKWLSNAAVLSSVAGVLVLDGILMQLVRGEDRAIHLLALIAPFVVVVLPVIALVSALAILFEMIPFLRGGLGNVVYFFGWLFALAALDPGKSQAPPGWRDPLGLFVVGGQIRHDLAKVAPSVAKGSLSLIVGGGRGMAKPHIFLWNGFAWTGTELAERLGWCAVAVAIVALAALIFDRFASGARPSAARGPKPLAVKIQTAAERFSSPLLDLVCGSDFGGLVLAEMRLMLNGLHVWWYVVAAGLWIGTVAAGNASQSVALGLAWLWPMLVWSQMGTRESINDTEQFVYPSLHPLRRQFLALWVAGFAVALVAGSGSLLHWIVAGNGNGALGVLAGAAFIPSLAIACGAISGTTRLFEIVYLVLWYVGPMNHGAALDFTSSGAAPYMAIAALVLVVAAFAMRRVRLQRA